MKGCYFDAAYLAKCYVKEPDAAAVRKVARSAKLVSSSALSIAEVACVFHRHLREGSLTPKMLGVVHDQFLDDVHETWVMLPVTDLVLRKVGLAMRSLAPDVHLRAADAIHIVTALDAGFEEIWTNDRRLLAAAAHFQLKGRQVAAS
jgi:predicted nucleic acid-binding protein